MKKIVINACIGWFRLSLFAQKEYCKRKGADVYFYKLTDIGGYIKIDDVSDNSLFVYVLFQDLGEKIPSINDVGCFFCADIKRDDQILIDIIEEFGSKKVSGLCGNLKVVEIPDGIEWEIIEDHGHESVEGAHRSWS
jgi:hypothetical protein